jgi:hypothetical protein
MDKLRTPFFVAAAVLMLLVVMLEAGSRWMPQVPKPDVSSKTTDPNARLVADQIASNGIAASDVKQLNAQQPPGLAISALALLDGLLLYTIALTGAPFLFTDRISGRLQGIATLVITIIVLLVGILLLLSTLTQVMLMVSLFVSPPFGTIVYLAVWGFFDRNHAEVMLSLSMFLKLAFVVMLLLAQQKFIQNKGLVLIIVTSLLGTLIISFLQSMVPGLLVSITDGIGAIIVLILALIWAFLMFIGSIIAIFKAVV